ncbi:hypothetical protein BC938DRAFT_481194 [Jimgerdemannia flammicorona]|uniref:Xylanolytic transcriptional activator regulatory domain-containing protein n=1 Tax=Jimgerdemannia flammicorona TaxID=994334 RepID=A0A433QGT2_9FUNG|nr:hypothetical protein BC938DRAFT_481194 [Jimgerdemannia flammicorona]
MYSPLGLAFKYMDVLTNSLMPPLYDNPHPTKRSRITYGMSDLPIKSDAGSSALVPAPTMTASAHPPAVAAALLFESSIPPTTTTYGQNALGDLILGAANLFNKTTTDGSGANANNSMVPRHIVTCDEDDDDDDDDAAAVTWKLSLSPSSMTLDTNIQDVAGLYEVIEQLSANVADAKITEIKHANHDYDDSDAERAEPSVRRNKPAGLMLASLAVAQFATIRPQEQLSARLELRQDLVSKVVDVFFTCYNSRLFHIKRSTLGPTANSANLLVYSICAVAGKHAAQFHMKMDATRSNLFANAFFLRARALLEDSLLLDGEVATPSTEITLLSLLLLANAPNYCAQNAFTLGNTHTTMFITMALGMIYDLGLHKLDVPARVPQAAPVAANTSSPTATTSSGASTSSPRTLAQTEHLRRLAWLAYITDHRASHATQTPPIIRDDEPLPGWHVRFPEPIEGEDEQSSYGVMYLAQMARLTRWRKSNAMRRLYAPAQRGDRVPSRVIWELESELTNWHRALPKWLQYDATRTYPMATTSVGSTAMAEGAEKRLKLERFKVQLAWMMSADYHTAWVQLHLPLVPKRFASRIPELEGKGQEEAEEEEEEEEEEEDSADHNAAVAAATHLAQEQAQTQRSRSQISTFSSSYSPQSSPRSSASPRRSLSRSPSPAPEPLPKNSRLSALRSLRFCLEFANAIVAINEVARRHEVCDLDIDAISAASNVYLAVIAAPKPLPTQANFTAFEAITRFAAIDLTRIVRVIEKTVLSGETGFISLMAFLGNKVRESGIIVMAEEGAAAQSEQILTSHVKNLWVAA